jgi:magnesium-transporting ATPase (P-type)
LVLFFIMFLHPSTPFPLVAGTLTRNEMTAVQLRACMGDTGAFRFTGQGFSPDGELKRGDSAVAPQERARLMFALLPAVLCNDSALQASGNGAGDASSATVNVPIVETADHALAVSSMLVEPAGAADVPDAHMPVKSAAPAEGAAGMTPAAAASDSLAELGQDIDSRRRASAVIGTARSGSDSGIPHSRSRDIGDSSGPSGRRLPTMSAAELELARFAEAGGGNFKATAFAEGLEWQLTGDPTEGALLVAAMKAGWHNPAGAQARCPRLSTVPFDSDHKFMATLHDVPVPRALLLDAAAAAPAADPAVPSVAGSAAGGELVTNMRRLLLVKGAPDRIIARAAQQPRPGGNPFDTEPIDAEAWQACADSLSAEGLRVLALAMVEVPTTVTSVTAADITGGAPRLTLTALVGIVDPPRSECIAAIRECHSAGVRVAMITGDSPLTAKVRGPVLVLTCDTRFRAARCLAWPVLECVRHAIGVDVPAGRFASTDMAISQPFVCAYILCSLVQAFSYILCIAGSSLQAIGAWLGIPTSEVLTGQAMQAMSDEQLADHVGACNIYARATPEHKLRIVRALQGRYKLVCAMTGA